MTALEREYRFLIRQALREGDTKQAKVLVEWARSHYGLDLSDIAIAS